MNETNSLSLLSQPCTSVNQLIKTKKSSHFLHDILDIKSENELLNEGHSTTTTMMISSNSFNLAHYHTLNTSRNHTNRLVECVVCHDKSSGKHYGQYTCEGCKSFFKRSVRRNLIYQCRSTRNCPIDQHHRNQCQHCRFKKCIKMGMRREAVQRGRTPIQPANHLKTSNKNTSSKETVNNNNINENIALFSNINPNDLISNFAAKTIFNIFEWSLSIPLFSTLNQNDRIELLINSWQQLFILFCAQSNNIDDLFKSNDEIKQFQIELNRIKSLLLDFEESNYLKAIILFNPDLPKLESKDLIESYQNNFQISLLNLTNLKDKLRFGKLLLSLKTTNQFINTQSIENIFFKYLLSDNTNHSSIESIIKKILKWNLFQSMLSIIRQQYSNESDIPAILNAYYTYMRTNKL